MALRTALLALALREALGVLLGVGLQPQGAGLPARMAALSINPNNGLVVLHGKISVPYDAASAQQLCDVAYVSESTPSVVAMLQSNPVAALQIDGVRGLPVSNITMPGSGAVAAAAFSAADSSVYALLEVGGARSLVRVNLTASAASLVGAGVPWEAPSPCNGIVGATGVYYVPFSSASTPVAFALGMLNTSDGSAIGASAFTQPCVPQVISTWTPSQAEEILMVCYASEGPSAQPPALVSFEPVSGTITPVGAVPPAPAGTTFVPSTAGAQGYNPATSLAYVLVGQAANATAPPSQVLYTFDLTSTPAALVANVTLYTDANAGPAAGLNGTVVLSVDFSGTCDGAPCGDA